MITDQKLTVFNEADNGAVLHGHVHGEVLNVNNVVTDLLLFFLVHGFELLADFLETVDFILVSIGENEEVRFDIGGRRVALTYRLVSVLRSSWHPFVQGYR